MRTRRARHADRRHDATRPPGAPVGQASRPAGLGPQPALHRHRRVQRAGPPQGLLRRLRHAGGRLDPADHLPRLPVRHRLRRRYHPAVPAERRRDDLHHRGRNGGHLGHRRRTGCRADGRQPDPGQFLDADRRSGDRRQGRAESAAYAPASGVSDSAVSETWGSEISQRALLAVLVFLVAVAAFLWIRYEKRMAAGAVVSVLHDVVITAGIYSLSGFEVTPATVIGLLTILGFSLYDTVVVYDKVQENTKGLTSLNRRTYPEAANLADQPDADEVDQHLAHRAAAGGRTAGRRRGDPWVGHPQGPVAGDADRHAGRRVLLGVHRRPDRRRPETARPGDQGAHRPG